MWMVLNEAVIQKKRDSIRSWIKKNKIEHKWRVRQNTTQHISRALFEREHFAHMSTIECVTCRSTLGNTQMASIASDTTACWVCVFASSARVSNSNCVYWIRSIAAHVARNGRMLLNSIHWKHKYWMIYISAPLCVQREVLEISQPERIRERRSIGNWNTRTHIRALASNASNRHAVAIQSNWVVAHRGKPREPSGQMEMENFTGVCARVCVSLASVCNLSLGACVYVDRAHLDIHVLASVCGRRHKASRVCI